jgi:hypothetical protein
MNSHWSNDEDVGSDPHVEEPTERLPRMPAPQRSAELWEALFVLERDMVAELLDELGRCTIEQLATMFKVAMPAPAEVAPAPKPAPTDEQPRVWITEAERVRREYEAQRWDSSGRRITGAHKSAFAFTKNYEQPPPRGSHWSR